MKKQAKKRSRNSDDSESDEEEYAKKSSKKKVVRRNYSDDDDSEEDSANRKTKKSSKQGSSSCSDEEDTNDEEMVETVPSRRFIRLFRDEKCETLENTILLNQRDVFWEIVNFLDIEFVVSTLKLVCKQWGKWISHDFQHMWQKLFFQEFNIETIPKETINDFNYLKELRLLKRNQQLNEDLTLDPLAWEEDSDLTQLMDLEDFTKWKYKLDPFIFITKYEKEAKNDGERSSSNIEFTTHVYNRRSNGYHVQFSCKIVWVSSDHSERRDFTITYKDSNSSGNILRLTSSESNGNVDFKSKRFETLLKKLSIETRKLSSKQLLILLTLFPAFSAGLDGYESCITSLISDTN